MLMDMQSHRSGTEPVRMGQMIYRFPLSVAGGVFLTAGSQAPGWFQWLWSNRFMRFLSLISYNMYIWHSHLALRLRAWHIPPYADEMPQRAGEMPWQLHYTLLCFAGAAALAALLTFGWERPLRRLGEALFLNEGKHGKRKASGKT